MTLPTNFALVPETDNPVVPSNTWTIAFPFPALAGRALPLLRSDLPIGRFWLAPAGGRGHLRSELLTVVLVLTALVRSNVHLLP